MKHTRSLIALAVSGALLAGCGGGGGGSAPPDTGGYVPPDDNFPPPEEESGGTQFQTLDSRAATIETSESGVDNPSVTVALIDSGLDLVHEEFQGDNGVGKPIVASTHNSVRSWNENPAGGNDQTGVDNGDYGAADEVRDDYGHGTSVGSIIASRNLSFSQNSQLAVYDIDYDSDSGTASNSIITQALSDAADNGHLVANLSFEFDPVSSRQWWKGYSQGDNLENFIDKGGVVAVAAGNYGTNYSEDNADLIDPQTGDVVGSAWEDDLAEANSFVDQVLVVGALAGSKLATYSAYAGHDELVQSRFIVTQSGHESAIAGGGTAPVGGTSIAAPVVSAAMATMLAKWDHLTPIQVAQRLLDTTDRSFANQNDTSGGLPQSGEESDDYGDKSCGDSGDVDCGLYHYGQGRLDLQAALAPEGVPAVTTGATVDDPNAASITETSMSVPAAMAGAQSEIAAAMSEVAVFDELGRDYTVDMSAAVQTQTDPTRGLGWKMSAFLSGGAINPGSTYATEQGKSRQAVQIDSQGRLSMAAVESGDQALRMGAYHFGHGQSAPTDRGDVGMSMLSYSGNTPMADQVSAATGFNVAANLTDRIGVWGNYWQGEKRYSMNEMDRNDRLGSLSAGVSLALSDELDLTAGVARLQEDNGLLGMSGRGGMAMDSGSTIQVAQVGATYRFAGFSAFAHYQTGSGSANYTGSLVRSLDADVEQAALGGSFAFDSGRKMISAVASAPMHLSGGTASLRVPTGRTKEGGVIYRDQSVALSGNDAPRNYEVGYRQRLGKQTALGLNAVRMENALGAGEVDHGVMGMISHRF